MGRKRKDLSGEEKKSLLEAYDKLPKLTQKEAAKRLQIPRSTLGGLLKHRQNIVVNGDRKRQRNGKCPTVDAALVKWIKHEKERDAPLSGPVLKRKAESLAAQLGNENFKATDGWLGRFKKRENLLNQEKSIAQASVPDVERKLGWLVDVWQKLREGYDDHEVYSAQECGIYFRAVPGSTLGCEEEAHRVHGALKESVTVLLCCSVTGEKRKPFVVGPRCVAGVKQLPVRYSVNSSTWMTSSRFTEWVEEWERELRGVGQKALLLVDECAAHNLHSIQLANLKIVHLPTDSTGVVPIEQGVSRAFRACFHRHIFSQILEKSTDSGGLSVTQSAQGVSLLDGIMTVDTAWKEVEHSTIVESWQKAGLQGLARQVISNTREELEQAPAGIRQEEWDALVNSNSEITTRALTVENDVISEVRHEFGLGEEGGHDSGEGSGRDGRPDVLNVPTCRQLKEAFRTLQRGLMYRDFKEWDLLAKLEREVNRATDSNLKQTTVDVFLGKKTD